MNILDTKVDKKNISIHPLLNNRLVWKESTSSKSFTIMSEFDDRKNIYLNQYLTKKENN